MAQVEVSRVIGRMGRNIHGRTISRVLVKCIVLLVCLAAEGSAIASSASTAAPPSDDPWWDYQIIMWQPHTPEQNVALKNLGITGGEVIAKRIDLPVSSDPSTTEQLIGDRTPALIASNLPWYVDNIATDFYSPYHMLGSTAAFQDARNLYEQNHNDPAAFTRQPSLSDGAWL